MILKNILKRLTSNYLKGVDSNVYKLVKLFADESEELKDVLELTEKWRDIEQAEGKTLDKLGENVQELRLGRTDAEYRQAILIKISSNTSGGDIERLNEILEVIVAGFESIQEGHTFEPPLDVEPACILVKVLAQETNNLPFKAVDKITAGGIRTHWQLKHKSDINFDFEFKQSALTFPVCGTINAGQEVVLP